MALTRDATKSVLANPVRVTAAAIGRTGRHPPAKWGSVRWAHTSASTNSANCSRPKQPRSPLPAAFIGPMPNYQLAIDLGDLRLQLCVLLGLDGEQLLSQGG